MSELSDRLVAAHTATATVPPRQEAPGFVTWDGAQGVACSRPMDAPPADWDHVLRELGLDPKEVQVVGAPEVRAWDTLTKGGQIVRMHYYKSRLAPREPDRPAVDELIKEIVKRRPRKPSVKPAAAPGTFVVGIGDLQLGKDDGDGLTGTVERVFDSLDRAVARLAAIRKHTPVSEVHLAWLGDGCEGFVSQGGANVWRTRLSMTEQFRALRRIMDHSVEVFLPFAESINLVSVPGNHDQAVRINGKGVTTYSDSWDVEAAVVLRDAYAMNAGRYGRVRVFTPDRDGITVTVPLAGGLTIGHAHGNHHRPGKHWEWWQGHNFSDQAVGRADILHEAHGHHLHIEQRSGRTYLMNPAGESVSTWWLHQTGQIGQPGILTYSVTDKRISDLAVL